MIVQLRKITAALDETIAGVGGIVEKSAPVNDIVQAINQQLDAGVDLLEGLLVKKAGMTDAVGLVDGLYPGAAASGFRNFPESSAVNAPRIGEVYTRGTLTLARLGREAPIAAASPNGPVLRNVAGGSLAARLLYPEVRQSRPDSLPRSPVIGTGAPVQYKPSEQSGGATPDAAETREKGPWRRSPSKASFPPTSEDPTPRASCWRRIRSSAARSSEQRPDPTSRRPRAAST